MRLNADPRNTSRLPCGLNGFIPLMRLTSLQLPSEFWPAKKVEGGKRRREELLFQKKEYV